MVRWLMSVFWVVPGKGRLNRCMYDVSVLRFVLGLFTPLLGRQEGQLVR